MAFDPYAHIIKMVVINCGKWKYPDEKDLTKLYRMASEALGMPLIETTSKDQGVRDENLDMAIYLPQYRGSQTPDPEFLKKQNEKRREIEEKTTKQCPNCKENRLRLYAMCQNCDEAENRKYKTIWICGKCEHKIKETKTMFQQFQELGIEIEGMVSKKDLGIGTMTNEGIK